VKWPGCVDVAGDTRRPVLPKVLPLADPQGQQIQQTREEIPNNRLPPDVLVLLSEKFFPTEKSPTRIVSLLLLVHGPRATSDEEVLWLPARSEERRVGKEG